MANPKKLPKWAIKQAGGINKKAWALARRGRGKAAKPRKATKKSKRKTVRRTSPKRGNPVSRKEKIGAVLKGARAGDMITGPAQGVLLRGEGPKELIGRYNTRDAALTSAKAAGVGLIRNAITSKSGAYRGVSQNKILSYVQVLAAEITAASGVNPLADPVNYNYWRHMAYEAYNPSTHDFDPGRQQFRDSAILQAVAWGAQKLAQKLGINKMLPKGVNL